jgi:hypothetical protein
MPFSFIPCLLRRSHGLLHACYVVLPIRRLLNIYVVFHLFVSSLLLTFLLFFLARCRSPEHLPERLSPIETVPSPSSRMPAKGRIQVSALGPSSLSVPRGWGRGRRLGRHRVVPSVGGSMLPSWILGNPIVSVVGSFDYLFRSATNAESFPSCSSFWRRGSFVGLCFPPVALHKSNFFPAL